MFIGNILKNLNNAELFLPFSFDVATVASGFVIWGYLLTDYIEKIEKRTIINIGLLGASCVGIYISYLSSQQNGWTVMAIHAYGNFLQFILTALLMNICILAICRIICSYMPVFVKPLQYVGRHSLLFYVLQSLAFIYTDAILRVIGIDPYESGTIYNLFQLMRDTLISIIIIIPFCFIITKYVPVLEGK